MAVGFEAIDTELWAGGQTGAFCHGDSVSLADVCLVLRVANARRFEVDMAPYPIITRIDAACREIEAFAKAAPENFSAA